MLVRFVRVLLLHRGTGGEPVPARDPGGERREHGVEGALGERLVGLTLWIVAISIVVHGLSVTPVMRRYETWRERRTKRFRPSGP